MSWSPLNLFAMSTKNLDNRNSMRQTLFQSRFIAKRDIRGYHLPNISEKQFIAQVNPLVKTRQMTKNEREGVVGMGSLLMSELERRIDCVVFRCHFADSIMQARRFVTRGYVKVNGEKCVTPFTKLKDGDMISVDPKVVVTLKGPKKGQREFNYVPYMAPHLFIPPYLEVNYPTCSAILLRTPLPQVKNVEIPSPYPPDAHALVHEHYSGILRRKQKVTSYSQLKVCGINVKFKPKYEKIVRDDRVNLLKIKNGEKVVIEKRVKKVVRRRTLRPRFKPKRDRYTLKYG